MASSTAVTKDHGKRTVIVTGSARGIGKAIALRLAQDGFDVCINDISANQAEIDETVQEIRSLGRASYGHVADVSKLPEVEELVAASVKQLGKLDVMIANAGIAQVKAMLELTEEDVRRVFEVNVFGVFNCYREAASQMIRQGGGGKIIGAASIVAFKPFAMLSHYSASKFAVRGFTQVFAMEMASHNITVNGYAPGIVGTAMWELIDEELGKTTGSKKGDTIQKYSEQIALGRTSVPEDTRTPSPPSSPLSPPLSSPLSLRPSPTSPKERIIVRLPPSPSSSPSPINICSTSPSFNPAISFNEEGTVITGDIAEQTTACKLDGAAERYHHLRETHKKEGRERKREWFRWRLGILVEEKQVTQAEIELWGHPKLGSYRCRPSGLRKVWTVIVEEVCGDMSWADEVNDAVEAGELPSMPIEKDCIQRNEGLWYAQASFIETSINSTLSPEASPYSQLFEPDHLTGTPPSHSLKVSDEKSSTAACYLSGNVNTAGNENLQLLERHWFDNIWKQVSPKHEVEDKDVREPAISRSVSSVNERMRLNERQMLREWGKLESNFYAHWAINGWPEGSSKYKKAMREKKIRAWNKKRQARIERPWQRTRAYEELSEALQKPPKVTKFIATMLDIGSLKFISETGGYRLRGEEKGFWY
ncbi:hypothetical protein B7494_g7251 [Chlorociboria aeruginascens]|nr:hypothetical protein B7494_g7251 [Chlorociboria aeruginascens]